MTTKKQINSLTPEMKSSLPIIRDKWIAYGRSTAPIDKEKARLGVQKIYELVKLPMPKMVILDNPRQLEYAQQYLLDNSSLGQKSEAELAAHLKWLDYSQLKKPTTQNNFYLYYWFDWLAYAEVFKDRVDACTEVSKYADYYKELHIINPLSDVCLVSQRPEIVKVDDAGRLHNANGPALAYAGNFSVYAWHGLSVPAWFIENPEHITANTIEKESNQELRRCMISILGGERFVAQLGAIKVHEDKFGVLWKKQVVANLPPVVYAELTNSTAEPDGTFKKYWLRVDSQSQSAHEGVGRSFGFGDDWKLYNPEVET